MENKQTYTIPDSLAERDRLRILIDTFIDNRFCNPPLSLDELSLLSDQFIREHGLSPLLKGWIMVQINNCAWQETVASIPFDKRIVLLPKCLSNTSHCQADIDELGLLCHQCYHCSIPNLQQKAESLGMMSIVAEGFTSAVALIENKVVDAVIGVSCLHSLEKAFPLLINNAVPGLAIPLNTNGCQNTHVDLGYLNRLMALHSEKEANLLDYNLLKSTITDWFSSGNLALILSPSDDPTSTIALEWMGAEGKRWRPYLLAATFMALNGNNSIPKQIHLAAIAVECFHKASLIHDDIQDNDLSRYGKPTVNATWGIPVAINVGDHLLGEGYRLLAGCSNMELIKVAVEAHLSLCKGQGMELAWSNAPTPFTMDFVMDIFCNKTVPAFEVALIMAVILSGDDKPLRESLHQYSRALGIAYQLNDDIEDFETDAPVALRPSAVLALICELNTDEDFIDNLLKTYDLKSFLNQPAYQPYLHDALLKVRSMAKHYHQAALDALHNLSNVELKRLLFRVTQRILK